jgi:hypothetical protein
LAVAVSSIGADLTGRWHGSVGNTELGLNLKVEGKKLSGTIYTADGDGPISNGKISGSTFSFTYATNGLIVPYNGKFDGDQMELTMIYQEKESKGTLTRVKDNEAIRIPARMRPQMTEYWEPVPKIITPAPYAGLIPLLLMRSYSSMEKTFPNGKAATEAMRNGKSRTALLLWLKERGISQPVKSLEITNFILSGKCLKTFRVKARQGVTAEFFYKI